MNRNSTKNDRTPRHSDADAVTELNLKKILQKRRYTVASSNGNLNSDIRKMLENLSKRKTDNDEAIGKFLRNRLDSRSISPTVFKVKLYNGQFLKKKQYTLLLFFTSFYESTYIFLSKDDFKNNKKLYAIKNDSKNNDSFLSIKGELKAINKDKLKETRNRKIAITLMIIMTKKL
ncbi:hypothetical protein BpHYR1_003233 [Brachionus plicatilis]|uniref:Uncharacterized protein n=1 Tax=Brachionus plicatilis TaxID=10195 RepID=A0A3M7SF29_BRAPC|nr:hypothetical protein BpHYR1_003233 [Brachionus plicatilis]